MTGHPKARVPPTTLARFTFTYDGVGNRTVVRDSAGAWTTYTYDAKSRLTQDATSNVNAHTYNYTYDATDNRLTANEGAWRLTRTMRRTGW